MEIYKQYINYINNQLGGNFDLTFRPLELELGGVYVVFMTSICDGEEISKNIIVPLLDKKINSRDIEVYKSQVITNNVVENIKNEKDAVTHLLNGHAVILFEFLEDVICCEVKKLASRNIEIPPAEAVLKGPREGFTENILINVSLIRKRLKDKDLKFEKIYIGEKAEFDVIIVYIKNVAQEELVQYIRSEINKMKIDFTFQSNYIIEQLETRSSSFDTIGYTEKPDIFVSKVSEGRVGILMQGESSAVTAPFFFLENFQSPNDYNLNIYVANYIRALRWIAFGIALLLPGLYIALTTHHFSLIPRMLIFRLAIARAGVPFPTFIEVLLLMFFFQVLREAGIRLPQPIGQSISIVGALILGDVAVASGLASTITVLVVSLSAITTFLIPTMSLAIVLWANLFIIASTIFGLPGFYIMFAIYCSHLAGITTCGYPYLFPLGTLSKYKKKDVMSRGFLHNISNSSLTKDEKR
ncbi:MAG: spore germination protein [Firmicutes bacterium HGW-Firmicutes-1]|jgi:hypothetical protein|nr:MAG: spore germination protein [Firmicutes bacterium HGW-Firmicutes-1]